MVIFLVDRIGLPLKSTAFINALLSAAIFWIAIRGVTGLHIVLQLPIMIFAATVALLWVNYLCFGITIPFGGGSGSHIPSVLQRLFEWLWGIIPRSEAEKIGTAVLPTRVYVGDSHEISLTLQDLLTGESKSARFDNAPELYDRIEVELLAAGVAVDGERNQKAAVVGLSYRVLWSCYFPNSGHHTLTFNLKAIRSNGSVEIGSMSHRVRVVKLNGFTQREVWIIGVLLALISGIAAVLKVLQALRFL